MLTLIFDVIFVAIDLAALVIELLPSVRAHL
jgi:hypothetical protein